MMNPYQARVEKFDNHRQIEEPNRRREETLIYILNNRPYMVRELHSSCRGQWKLFNFCEHVNESSNTITRAKFVDYIGYYLFFKASAPLSYCVKVYMFLSAFSVNCITGRRNTIHYLNRTVSVTGVRSDLCEA